ncbi:hypothetical protein A5692_20355 [Mycobacterium sp. E342]|nr:hypothetical protein A5692_20355 [Mycobacterium sp. E342]
MRTGPRDEPTSRGGPIGFAHNGSHVDTGPRIRPITAPRDRLASPAQHQRNGAARGRRHRRDPDDDPTGYGRHSSGS